MTITIRPAGPADLPFIREMFTAAANWDPALPPITFDKVIEDEHMLRYVIDWGRPGDVCFIAEDERVPVGATWRRFYPAASPGYGFIAEDIPEVSIGVRSEWRGQGIGGALLSALADQARGAGLPALCLSVELGNPAIRLYLRQGYRMVRSSDEDHVLRLDLGAPSGAAT